MSRVTRWWWVRHAPVTENNGCCYGQTDFGCDLGDEAAFAGLARLLPREAVWVTSPLKRTHLTAAGIVRAGLPGPDPIPGPGVAVEADLIEQHFGDWQGRTYAEIDEMQGENRHQLWLAPAQLRPKGGESFVDLLDRARPAIRRISQSHEGRDIISVSHGGVIRAALAEALDLDPERALAFTVDNLSLTVIERFSDAGVNHGWRVVVANRPPR